jgi:hypothetical protein
MILAMSRVPSNPRHECDAANWFEKFAVAFKSPALHVRLLTNALTNKLVNIFAISKDFGTKSMS